MLRWGVWIGAVGLTALVSPEPALAHEAVYDVRIPAGALGATLMDVSKATGAQFAFAEPGLAGRRSGAVTGRYTLAALLRVMLRNTGADFRMLGPATVLILARPTPPPRHRIRSAPADNDADRDETPARGIVVSALKHDEWMSDVPVSIAAYSQDTLDQRGINDMRAIARTTPGVLYRDGWASSSNLSIRGIYSNTGSATTGVYVDDTPIQVRSLGAGVSATNIYPMLFDLERVEVLRGPQGALFGAGSEGGAIRFITRQPDFDKVTSYAESEGFLTSGGEPGGEVGASFGMPLVHGRMALRVAGFARRDGGWIDRVSYPDARLIQANANRLESYAARISLGLRLGDAVTVTPSLFIQHSDQRDSDQIWSLLSGSGQDRRQNGFRIAQPAHDDFVLASLRLQAELGAGMTLQSSSSYFRRRRPSTVDYTDYFIEMFSRGALFSLPAVPDYISRVSFNNDQDVATQELRLSSREDARMPWVFGLFAQRAQQDAIEYIHEPALPQALQAITGRSMVSYFGSDMLPGGISYIGKDRAVDWQVAAFGRATIPLTTHIQAGLGGRIGWTGYRQTNYQAGPQSGSIPSTTIHHGEIPLLPDISLNWHPAKGRLIYASIAKGTRPGGGNPPVSIQRCGARLADLGLSQVPGSFASDEIWNFELGGKFTLPRGLGSLSASAYHFLWHNIQQSYSLACLFRFTGNNAEARGQGLEVAFDLTPARGVSLSLTGSYTHAAYTGTTYGDIVDQTTMQRAVVIPAGQQLPSPPWRISGVLRYQHRLSGAWTGYIEGSGDHASSYAQGYAPGSAYFEPGIWISPSITTLRLQCGVRRGLWEAAAYADNVLDSADAVQVAHNNPNSSNMRYILQRPRTIGLRLTYGGR